MAFDWDKRPTNAESSEMPGAWASDLLLNKHRCGALKRRACIQGRENSQVGYEIISPKEAEEQSEASGGQVTPVFT